MNKNFQVAYINIKHSLLEWAYRGFHKQINMPLSLQIKQTLYPSSSIYSWVSWEQALYGFKVKFQNNIMHKFH